MKRSMFSYLFTLLLILALLLTGTLTGVFYLSIRDRQIDQRMNQLKREADELAYMAERMYSERMTSIRSVLGSVSEDFVLWKLSSIYQEYNAYSILLSTDRASFLYETPAMKDDDVIANIDADRLNAYLNRLMRGETIAEQTAAASGPMFTVAVPWTVNNVVRGGVFIQTTAQTIRALYSGLVLQVSAAALIMFLIAAFLAYIMAKRITHPISDIASTAESMKNGNFEHRAPVAGSTEVRSLALRFNAMADQLQVVEQTRRDFVANVSHELRSPITSIQGYTEGMLDGTIAQDEQTKYLEIISSETHRLSKLISNLLNLSRMDNPTPLSFSDFDINEMTRRIIISRINQIEQKDQELCVDISDDKLFVHADYDLIYQVIINLLDNAIKYTQEKGQITVSTRLEGGLCRLQVKDNGIGIAPEDRPFIFDRFYKADKAHTVGKGTGLGLAICKRIMDKHDQTITLLDSDQGSAFEITLMPGNETGAIHEDKSIREDQLES